KQNMPLLRSSGAPLSALINKRTFSIARWLQFAVAFFMVILRARYQLATNHVRLRQISMRVKLNLRERGASF
ncbi:MAG: hypothetical protein ACERJ2_18390, partial [Filomicrobium sp.]